MKRIILLLMLIVFSFPGCRNDLVMEIGNRDSADSLKRIEKTEEINPMAGSTMHEGNPYYSRTDTTELNLPDSVWEKVLPAGVYQVARNKATELAFTGKYWDFEGVGTYYCAACGNTLFRSDAKFASSCGWPSFYEPIRKNSVIYEPDNSYGMQRTEVLCGRCGGHLGHIFDDGPPPTGKRFCMNSIVLEFEPDPAKPPK